MSLLVVEQFKPEQKPVVKYALSDEIKQLIDKYFIKNQTLVLDKHTTLLNSCKKIYEHNWWIQCDCQASPDKPLFRFKRSSNGRLFLSRLTDRASHLTGCVFKESPSTGASQSKSVVYRPFTGLTGVVNLVNQRADGLSAQKSSSKSTSSKSSNSRPTHKLAKVLYMLLNEGGFNHYNPMNKLGYKRSLDKATQSIQLTNHYKAAEFFKSNIKALIPLSIELRNSKGWPKKTPKHGLMLVKVQAFKDNVLEVVHSNDPKGKNQEIIPIEIHNRIYQWSGRFSERTAPYMALILVTDLSSRPGFFVPFNAFLMPCYNLSTNMPVDSYYERKVLEALFRLAGKYKDSTPPIEIIKPVMDIPVIDEEGNEHYVLPDILIKRGNKTLVIEVNGSHEEEYLTRKTRIHQLMSNIGEVFSIDIYGAEKGNHFYQSINQLVEKVGRELQ